MRQSKSKIIDYENISNQNIAEQKTCELLEMALAMAPPFLQKQMDIQIENVDDDDEDQDVLKDGVFDNLLDKNENEKNLLIDLFYVSLPKNFSGTLIKLGVLILRYFRIADDRQQHGCGNNHHIASRHKGIQKPNRVVNCNVSSLYTTSVQNFKGLEGFIIAFQ